jgi:ribosomal protein S18 acetylase RimI-like enzyme
MVLQSATVEGVLYRPANHEDIPGLAALLNELFAIESDFAPNSRRGRSGLQLLLEHPERAFVAVAEKDGSIIGMCTIQSVFSTAEGGFAGLIEDCVVTKPVRGAGVGKRLLAIIAQWALNQGLSRLQLLADTSNSAALGFYRATGWTQTSLICYRQYLACGQTREDESWL